MNWIECSMMRCQLDWLGARPSMIKRSLSDADKGSSLLPEHRPAWYLQRDVSPWNLAHWYLKVVWLIVWQPSGAEYGERQNRRRSHPDYSDYQCSEQNEQCWLCFRLYCSQIRAYWELLQGKRSFWRSNHERLDSHSQARLDLRRTWM